MMDRPKRWPLCSHAGGCQNYVEDDPDLYCTMHKRKGERRDGKDRRRYGGNYYGATHLGHRARRVGSNRTTDRRAKP